MQTGFDDSCSVTSEVLMSKQTDPRMYAIEKLIAQEVFAPEKCLQMLEFTPVERVIEGLSLWAFLPTQNGPSRSILKYLARPYFLSRKPSVKTAWRALLSRRSSQ